MQTNVHWNGSGAKLLWAFWANVVLSNTMLWHPKCHNKSQPKPWYVINNRVQPFFIYHGFTGMIKKCLWRGQPVSCAAIFRMQPTDRGMCCSFNKEKAEDMFKESRYQEHVMKMNEQDETMSMGGLMFPNGLVRSSCFSWYLVVWYAQIFLDLTLSQKPVSQGVSTWYWMPTLILLRLHQWQSPSK